MLFTDKRVRSDKSACVIWHQQAESRFEFPVISHQMSLTSGA